MKKKYLLLTILFITIGFATVSANLFANGNVLIAFDFENAEIYLANLNVNGINRYTNISNDKKSISLDIEPGESVIDAYFTNNATDYNAEVYLSCNSDELNNVTVENSDGTNILLEAQTIEKETYVVNNSSETQTLTCLLCFNPIESEIQTTHIKKVMFSLPGIELETTYKVIDGNTYGELPEIDNEDYTLLGWYKEPTYEVEVTSETLVETNLDEVLYGKLEENMSSYGENIHITLDIDKTGNINFLSDSFNGITDAVVYVDGKKQSSFVKNYTFATAGKHSVNIYPKQWNSMENMFNGCQYITSVKFSNLNTYTNFTSLEGMFKDCTNLRYVDLSEFDKVTSNVTTLEYMFKGCSNIESIDMSNVDLSKVNNLISTFEGCSELSKVEFANTKTKELISIADFISGCSALCHLDLSSFVIGTSTSLNENDIKDCDNKDFIFSDDIDFIVFMGLGCGDVGGGGSRYYNLSSRSCESSCSLNYERKCVEQCPSYTSKEGNTCVRTSDWYKQFEP